MKKFCLAFLLIALLQATAAFAAIDLNTATKEQLDTLPGIGPKKAEAIIQYRAAKGTFKSVEELKEVSGIGDKIFQGIKNEVTVGAAPAAAQPAEEKSTPEAKPQETASPAVKAEEEKKPEAAAAAEAKK